MLDYNFVLYFSRKDYNKIVYSDFDNMDGVEIHHGFYVSNTVLKKIQIFHNSERINRYFNLPFKSVWYANYLSKPDAFYNDKPLCFVFMFVWVHLTFVKEYILFLRKKFPNAKFVCYYTDIISTLAKTPDEIRDLFDVIITYDRNDAINYNLLYFPTSFSNYTVNSCADIDSCDVIFLGKAKDRLNKIYTVYHNLVDLGYNCNFYLVGVPQENRILGKGLFFLDRPMGYEQYLQHVYKSRFILEIEQNGAVGETLRNWEAIHFNKGLLTDNPGIKESEFYDDKYISLIDNEGGVDVDFLESYQDYENPLKDAIRPIRLLEYIQKIIKQVL